MKQLKCRDLSNNCDYVAQGENTEKVKEQMMKYGQEAHPEITEGVSEEDMQKWARIWKKRPLMLNKCLFYHILTMKKVGKNFNANSFLLKALNIA